MSKESKKVILVVDDDPANISILLEILEDKYECIVALDGFSALDSVQEYPPDLLLLDIIMPGMDGYEVCRKLKSNVQTEKIPVIFITAQDEIDDELEGFNVGAVDYITKPVSRQIVLARVKTHLSMAGYVKQLEKEKEINDNELQIAKKVQRSFIPDSDINNDIYDICSFYLPKRAIGGDFFDYYLNRNNDISIMVADVSGHGIPAALLTSMIKISGIVCNSMYKSSSDYDPSNILRTINNNISDIIGENFVAAIIGKLYNEQFIFSNAGQCFPIMYKKSEDRIMKIRNQGTVLGPFKDMQYENSKIILGSGDHIFLYTDGVVESGNNSQVDREKVFINTIFNNKNLPIKKIIKKSIENINSLTGGFEDDVTIIGINVK